VGNSASLVITKPKAEPGMTVQLLKRILQKCCRHRFSWPHTNVYGQDYQVCLSCGAAYAFDCATMSRTGRLLQPEGSSPDGSPARPARISRTD
jgi:hypothetical protein